MCWPPAQTRLRDSPPGLVFQASPSSYCIPLRAPAHDLPPGPVSQVGLGSDCLPLWALARDSPPGPVSQAGLGSDCLAVQAPAHELPLGLISQAQAVSRARFWPAIRLRNLPPMQHGLRLIPCTGLDSESPPFFIPSEEQLRVNPIAVGLESHVDHTRFAQFQDPAGWLAINPANGTVTTKAALDRESPYVHDSQYTSLFLAIDN
eukprot:g38443.t1